MATSSNGLHPLVYVHRYEDRTMDRLRMAFGAAGQDQEAVG